MPLTPRPPKVTLDEVMTGIAERTGYGSIARGHGDVDAVLHVTEAVMRSAGRGSSAGLSLMACSTADEYAKAVKALSVDIVKADPRGIKGLLHRRTGRRRQRRIEWRLDRRSI